MSLRAHPHDTNECLVTSTIPEPIFYSKLQPGQSNKNDADSAARPIEKHACDSREPTDGLSIITPHTCEVLKSARTVVYIVVFNNNRYLISM